ncbi:MAG: hypothetical protein PWP31_1615 [Clostridia bacterium]|nr:hypothetical protein [Clostridia bacterium]
MVLHFLLDLKNIFKFKKCGIDYARFMRIKLMNIWLNLNYIIGRFNQKMGSVTYDNINISNEKIKEIIEDAGYEVN